MGHLVDFYCLLAANRSDYPPLLTVAAANRKLARHALKDGQLPENDTRFARK